MIIYGKNSVIERLKANPSSIKKIFLQENFSHPEIERLIKLNKLSKFYLSVKQFRRIKPYTNLQGIVAEVSDFNYVAFDKLIGDCSEKKILLFLDRICDPQNLGAIIRIAACFGNIAIVIPKYKSVNINETVLHVAEGGENYVDVSLVSNLCSAILKAKKNSYWIVGATLGFDAKNINEFSFPFPLGFVFGSEGEGIRYGIRKYLDFKVTIPMGGAKLSLNVASATAIFCFEAIKQLKNNINGKNK